MRALAELEKTRQIAKRILEELSRHRYVDRTYLAAIYAVLGERTKAFAGLPRLRRTLRPH